MKNQKTNKNVKIHEPCNKDQNSDNFTESEEDETS